MLQLPKLGYVWANCKQPSRCLWYGGGHLNRECPENTNAESTPRCCNCTLVEAEKPHSASYRGCSYAKGELQKRKAQRALKASYGRTFFSKLSSPEQSYEAALRQDTKHKQPQASQTDGKSVQQHLTEQEI
jgi:hypothetical protein